MARIKQLRKPSGLSFATMACRGAPPGNPEVRPTMSGKALRTNCRLSGKATSLAGQLAAAKAELASNRAALAAMKAATKADKAEAAQKNTLSEAKAAQLVAGLKTRNAHLEDWNLQLDRDCLDLVNHMFGRIHDSKTHPCRTWSSCDAQKIRLGHSQAATA